MSQFYPKKISATLDLKVSREKDFAKFLFNPLQDELNGWARRTFGQPGDKKYEPSLLVRYIGFLLF